jgi:glycosyltransferase involved in cell wall biosynthesis
MIYVCIPSYNEAPTIGLLLWKIRQVFAGFQREYQLLVLDDGSTDGTGDVLERYTRVLPLSVTRHEERQGYARSIEQLLRQAVERTDRPKRDCAILMHADFAHGPSFIPDLVRRVESGADVVVAQPRFQGEPSRLRRWARRLAPMLLRGAVTVPGVSDLVSGFAVFRLVTLRNAFRSAPEPLLGTQGWAANAELYARTSRHARRVETITVIERGDLRQRESRVKYWEEALSVWTSRQRLRRVSPQGSMADSPAGREPSRQAEAASPS